MRAPSALTTVITWAAAAGVVFVSVPIRDRTAVSAAAGVLLVGFCLVRLRAATRTMAGLLRDELAPDRTGGGRWVALTEESRSVRLGALRRLRCRGVTVRGGVGAAVLAQRWVPYGDHRDEGRLAMALRAVAQASDSSRVALPASVGEGGVPGHQHVEAHGRDETERPDRHDAGGQTRD